MRSLGRAPMQEDLGPFSSVSLSSSLVPYEDDSPEDEQNQPEGAEGMGNVEEDTTKKEEAMEELSAIQTDYVPQSPKYIPADEDEDMSSNEDLEAPYLAPHSVNPAPPVEDLRAGYYSVPKDQPTPQTTTELQESTPYQISWTCRKRTYPLPYLPNRLSTPPPWG